MTPSRFGDKTEKLELLKSPYPRYYKRPKKLGSNTVKGLQTFFEA